MSSTCKICECTRNIPCFCHKYGFCWRTNSNKDISSHCKYPEIKDDSNNINCIHGLEFPVLTVHQPYALMLVKGVKKIEYRRWKLPQKYVGQRIFIHAGKDLHCQWDKHYSDEEPFYQCRGEAIAKDLYQMILGSVVFGKSLGPFNGIKYDAPYEMYEWPVYEPIKLDKPLIYKPGKQRIWKIKF